MKCHGCVRPVQGAQGGCPHAIYICLLCKNKPKRLKAAREAMEMHLATHRIDRQAARKAIAR